MKEFLNDSVAKELTQYTQDFRAIREVPCMVQRWLLGLNFSKIFNILISGFVKATLSLKKLYTWKLTYLGNFWANWLN